MPPGIVEPRALSWQAGTVILGQGGNARGGTGGGGVLVVLVVRRDCDPECVRFAVARRAGARDKQRRRLVCARGHRERMVRGDTHRVRRRRRAGTCDVAWGWALPAAAPAALGPGARGGGVRGGISM